MPSADYLLQLNAKHAQAFSTAALKRRLYRAQHPTEIGVLKCMDGRLHLPVITETELGIIQPWRNLGGKFNLGWLGFQQTIRGWVDYSIGRGRHCLVLVTYHYARGDVHRGCKGFNYNTDEARTAALKLKKQFDRVFGRSVVYAIQCGIETDLDALVLHGENGEAVDLATLNDASAEALTNILRRLYPDMPGQVLLDFLPLLQGNIAHISKIRASNRPVAEAEHKEWVLAVGRGFDWLHEINTALIVGPFDPDMAGAIRTAAALIKSNLADGRIAQDGVVLLTSAPYRDGVGPDRRLAVEKATFLNDFALNVIRQDVPELLPHLQLLSGVVNVNTRQLEVLHRG